MFKALVEMPGAFLSALIKCLPFFFKCIETTCFATFSAVAFSQDLLNQSEPSEEERKAAQSKLDDKWLCFCPKLFSVQKSCTKCMLMVG